MSKSQVIKQKLSAQIEAIYIENHPDKKSSGMSSTGLIYWGLRMGLISEGEKDRAMGFHQQPECTQ